MPAYKNDKTGKWETLFYYTDYKNERRKKHRRGFNTKKEALEFEREFLAQSQFSIEMTFKSLYSLYHSDMESRIKKTTMETKEYIVNTKLLPFFEKMKVKDIKPIHIRKWQTDLLKMEYSKTYLKTIYNQLTAIFNYAIRFHNLDKNPCHIAGSIGKKDADEMQILSLQEFNKMIDCVTDKENKFFYIILFWTGMRKGELLALTYEDVDFENKTIMINKNFQIVKKERLITDPKTPRGRRVIAVNDIVLNCIEDLWSTSYKPNKTDKIFYLSKDSLKRQLDTACKKAGVPRIRVHDLRHSHASYLLSNGVNIVILSRRLGHEKVQTTLNIYCHICPSSEDRLNDVLNG
ncbi:site-specific integrase [Fusobacterium animalis]|uniref:Site-specific integrase n=1 Tax=Fusobacterium animalis TaxID=76859 RepID=A0A2G9FM90_9FUSO|nr:site-specific integrase [Fusobacterium animalis]PIM93106.1 site-specific integrase [Fusobacterium animalis]PIM94280.1 site-specific integrase [Fusobacterium animalis]